MALVAGRNCHPARFASSSAGAPCRRLTSATSSPPTLTGVAKAARLIRWLIAAFLLSAILPLTLFAQFTEVYPYVKTAVDVDRSNNGTIYFTHGSTNAISAVILSTGTNITYSVNDSLSRPSGLAVDVDSSLLIADTGNHRIVRLNTTTGLLTAVYTTTPALHWPCDVAVSSVDGSVLIADTWNHRIVKLSSKGEQMAVYTTRSPSLHYPAGVSVSVSGSVGGDGSSTGRSSRGGSLISVWIADTGNNRIVQLSGDSGEQLAVYTTSSPALSAPLGVVVDSDGALHIADSGNNRVVKLSATGAQLAVYGLSERSLQYPSGVVMSSAGEVFVADSGNNRIVRLQPLVEEYEYHTEFPSLRNATGVAVDSTTGSVLVVDTGNRRR